MPGIVSGSTILPPELAIASKQANNGPNRYRQLRALNPRHFLIIDRILAGVQQQDIAKELGLTPAVVGTIVHAPQFQQEIAVRRALINEQADEKIASQHAESSSIISQDREAVAEILRKGTVDAANKLVSLVEHADAKVARQASNDVLDRAGVPRVTRQESTSIGLIAVIDDERAELIRQALMEDRDVIVQVDAVEPASSNFEEERVVEGTVGNK